MIPFTPDAVANCFSTVVADVSVMNNSSVNAWFKSTFPEVAQIANQNPSLFNPALANSNITAIPKKPANVNFSKFGDERLNRQRSQAAREYNSAISKIKVAFAIDLRAAMGCAGYTEEQIKKAIEAFNKLLPSVATYK